MVIAILSLSRGPVHMPFSAYATSTFKADYGTRYQDVKRPDSDSGFGTIPEPHDLTRDSLYLEPFQDRK